MKKFLFLLPTLMVSVVQCSINLFSSKSNDALYLTKYIEKGQYDLAKSLSKVNSIEMKGVQSYSGYFTVDKLYNSNMFFWYFPAAVNSSTAPLVLYLAGGPGFSSLYDLFMGKFSFVN